MNDILEITEPLGDSLPLILPNLITTKNVIKSSNRRFFHFATKAHVPTATLQEAVIKELSRLKINAAVDKDDPRNLKILKGEAIIGSVVISNNSIDDAESALNQGIYMSINSYEEL